MWSGSIGEASLHIHEWGIYEVPRVGVGEVGMVGCVNMPSAVDVADREAQNCPIGTTRAKV